MSCANYQFNVLNTAMLVNLEETSQSLDVHPDLFYEGQGGLSKDGSGVMKARHRCRIQAIRMYSFLPTLMFCHVAWCSALHSLYLYKTLGRRVESTGVCDQARSVVSFSRPTSLIIRDDEQCWMAQCHHHVTLPVWQLSHRRKGPAFIRDCSVQQSRKKQDSFPRWMTTKMW